MFVCLAPARPRRATPRRRLAIRVQIAALTQHQVRPRLVEWKLTREQESFIQMGVQDGRFKDRADAVNRAMELFVRRERERLELIASLDEAELEIENGEFTEFTEETLGQLPSMVAERCKARLAAEQRASA